MGAILDISVIIIWITNTLPKMVEPGDKWSEHLLTLHLHTSEGPVKLISAYAPTLTSTSKAKDKFYTWTMPSRTSTATNNLFFLATLPPGADHASWVFLLRFLWNWWGQWECAALIGPLLQTKPQHRVSWRHHCSRHWHLSSTWSLSDVEASSTCFSPTHTPVLPATQTTHYYAEDQGDVKETSLVQTRREATHWHNQTATSIEALGIQKVCWRCISEISSCYFWEKDGLMPSLESLEDVPMNTGKSQRVEFVNRGWLAQGRGRWYQP